MIFYTIAFGERHVDCFFDNALYSIMRQTGLDAVRNKYGLQCLIATTTQSEPRVRERLARISTDAPDWRFDVITVDAEMNVPVANRGLLVSVLKRLCMIHCLNEDKKFFFIAPDTVYSPEVLGYALAQHELTGRVVAIFNGRVEIGFGETEKVRQYFARDRGVLRAYLENWDKVMNLMIPEGNDPAEIKIVEHAIVRADDFISVYTSNPNPTLGKFEMQDLLLFERAHSLNDWDHFWKERLLDQNRVYIQTNLDLGMSIELDDETSLTSAARRIQKTNERVGYLQLVRKASEQILKRPRNAADFSRTELGSRLNMVSFSARLK